MLVLLAIVVHAALPRLATLDATANELKQVRWWAVAIAVAAQVASFAGYGYTIRTLALIAQVRLPLLFSIRLALAGASVGVFAGGPMGFGAAIYRWLRNRGVSAEGATLCGSVPGFMNLAVLGALSVVGATYLLVHHVLGRTQLEALVTLGVLIVLLGLGIARVASNVERVTRVSTALRRRWRYLRRRTYDPEIDAQTVARVTAAYDLLRHQWRRPLLGAAAKIGFDMATLFALFLGTGHTIAPGVLIAGYALPQLIGSVSFLPGGIGVVEGGMTGLFAALGVPTPAAVLTVLAYRGISFWAPILCGVPLAFGLERGKRRGVRVIAQDSRSVPHAIQRSTGRIRLRVLPRPAAFHLELQSHTQERPNENDQSERRDVEDRGIDHDALDDVARDEELESEQDGASHLRAKRAIGVGEAGRPADHKPDN